MMAFIVSFTPYLEKFWNHSGKTGFKNFYFELTFYFNDLKVLWKFCSHHSKNQKAWEAINILVSQVHVGMLIPLTKEMFIMTHYD